jgi:hypothetical protein
MLALSHNLSRRDFALALLGAMTLAFTFPQMDGCASLDPQQQIENHLKQKYGDIQYTIFNFAPYNAFDHTYNELSAYLPNGNYNNDSFDAKLFTDGGTNAFQDSYYGLIIRTQFEEMIQKAADKYFKHSKAYTDYEDFPDEVTATTPLEQVLSEGKMAHNDINLYIDAEDYYKEKVFNEKKFDKDVQAFAEFWNNTCKTSKIWGMAIIHSAFIDLTNREYMDVIGEHKNDWFVSHKYVTINKWTDNPIPGVR